MNRSRSIVSVHTAKVNLRSIIFRMATIIVATLTPLVASAQMNPLVGTWLATIHASDGSTHTQRVTYYADGKWFAETANPPLPNGSGAGVVRTYGRYRLENQTTLHVIYGNTFLCPAGSGCAPYPRQYAGTMYYPPGTSKVFHFQFQGSNRTIAEDGTIANRIN